MATTWDTLYQVDSQVFGWQPSVLWAYISNDPWVRQHCKAALEIGGGYGRDAHFMVLNGVPKVVNVDMSSEAIKQAWDRTGKTLFSEVEHVCDDIFRFEPKGQTFDLTFSYHFIHLLPRRELSQFVRKLYDLTSGQGRTAHMFIRQKDKSDSCMVGAENVFEYAEDELSAQMEPWFDIIELRKERVIEYHGHKHTHEMWYLLAHSKKDRFVR